MSPSLTTPQAAFEIPESNCSFAQNLKSSESLSFSPGSTDGTGFDCLKTGPLRSNTSSRSKPRLTKVRRKQVERSVKTDLTLSGSSDVRAEVMLECKFGDLSGDKSRSVGSNGSQEQFAFGGGRGLGFAFSSNDSGFGLGLGNGKSSSGNSMKASASSLQTNKSKHSFVTNNVGSNSDVQKETGIPAFGAHKDGSTLDQNLGPGGSDFYSNKSGLRMASNFQCEHFVFGVDKSDSVWNSKFCTRESSGNLRQPEVNEFDKSSNLRFLFASDVKLNQQHSNKDGLHFSFDRFGKHSSTSFIFSSTKKASAEVNSIPEKHDFGNHLEKSDSAKDAEKKVPDMRAKVKADASGDSEKVRFSSFQFPSTTSVNSKQSNVNFVFGSNECEFQDASRNCFKQHVNNTGSDVNFKFQSRSSSFNISNGMKKLSIDESKVANRTENSSSSSSVTGDNVFVFGNNLRNSGFMKEDHPINTTKETSHVNHLSHDHSESNRKSTYLLVSHGIEIQPNGSFSEAPPMNNCEKDDTSFTNYLTPNMKFAYSSCNFTPGMNNTENKSWVSKRSKKKNRNLRQRTIVHPPFCQDLLSRGGSSEQNHKSPNCGSPMDFSPYQEAKAGNSPDAVGSTRLQGEFTPGEKNILEHTEKSHNATSNSNISPSLPSQDGPSSVRRQHKKKYMMKVSTNHRVQRNDSDKENAKQEPIGVMAHEVCEHWRIRGNEAYHAGKISKAEEFYSMGINSVPHASTVAYSIKPLLLCYSNRAATRMSLGRMTEAIGDCAKAEELDPNFLKVTLRAGNCYLVLGEVEDAIHCYSKCLNSRTDLCLDRRFTIEAAEGIQKAEKVADYMQQSAKLLQEGTDRAGSSALKSIEEALAISRYSEKLLEMKGKALFSMRLYDNVIQLCEQTLDIAKKNYDADQLDDPNCKHSCVKLWRWHLKTKSYYHLGRLDLALELIEKHEKFAVSSKSGDLPLESLIPLAPTIRELLCLKKSGNEAFNDGRYAEAIDNYTAAIAKSFESRPFMAVCFCNRAAAYQSVNQIVDAIADCSIAIALDENYQKAISRRATLYEVVRDYKQAACDLKSLVALLESKSQTKNQQNGSHSRSSGGGVRDLRKARRHLSSIEEKAKKEISLDHYLILGIKSSDSEAEIKKAYRKAALKHHPDKAGQVLARSDLGDVGTLWKEVGEKIHEDADKLFKVIGAAYSVLSDPSKRSQYDIKEELRNIYQDSHRSQNSAQPSTSYAPPSGFSASSERNNNRRYRYDSRTYGYSYSRW